MIPDADRDEATAAVAAARTAFDSGPWPRMPGRERARALQRIADLVRANAADLATVETLNTGKPINVSSTIDLGTTIDLLEYYAALAWSTDGTAPRPALPALAYTRSEPIGVVAAITPFNFPLVLSATKIAPALAAGNTVVHKPAAETPLSALRFAEIIAEAELPPGAYNLVTGAAETGAALVEHPGVDAVAFTGSTATGRVIAETAARTVKRSIVELGGKSANIVFADANLEAAIGAAAAGFVFNSGQFCAAGSRLLVERSAYDEVVAGLTAAVGTIPLGDPMAPETQIGPLAGPRHLERVGGFVDRATARDGASVLAGGARIADRPGFYYPPTVVADVRQQAEIVQEEVFGPVLTVQAFDGEAEAIALANGTRYGLAAGVQTSDLGRAHRVADALRAGTVWINTWGMLDVAVPFGGIRQSGHGREQGVEGLREYTQTKSVIAFVAPAPPS